MSEPAPIQQDAEHLRLLAVFHYVCAGLLALCACIPLIHLVTGLLMLFAPVIIGPDQNTPPQVRGLLSVMGLVFMILAGVIIAAGWMFAGLLAWAGRCLSRRQSYTFCFAMACLVCMVMPFGTVLGIFTIIVLLRPSVKILFAQPAPT
jgi:hypothetical protein